MVHSISPFSHDRSLIPYCRTKIYSYFLQVLLPHLADIFPSTVAQKAAFGPGASLIGNDTATKEGMEMERREAEMWGFVAA